MASTVFAPIKVGDRDLLLQKACLKSTTIGQTRLSNKGINKAPPHAMNKVAPASSTPSIADKKKSLSATYHPRSKVRFNDNEEKILTSKSHHGGSSSRRLKIDQKLHHQSTSDMSVDTASSVEDMLDAILRKKREPRTESALTALQRKPKQKKKEKPQRRQLGMKPPMNGDGLIIDKPPKKKTKSKKKKSKEKNRKWGLFSVFR